MTVVSPEPTPYRSPLFDRVARAQARPHRDLCRESVAQPCVVGRAGAPSRLPARRLVPGAERLLRHDYPVTPGIVRALRHAQPDVVVVSGWSTFASQRAIAWCRAHRVPYVLLVESHDLGPRAAWRQAVKGAIVPRLLRGAANVLVVGSPRASRSSRAGRPRNASGLREHDRRRGLDGQSAIARRRRPSGRRRCRRALGRATRSRRKGSTRSSARSPRRATRGCASCVAGDGPERGATGGARSGARRAADDPGSLRGRTSSPSSTSTPTSSRCSRATSRGVSSSTRRRPPACRSCSRTGSAPRRICLPTAETASSFPRATSRTPRQRLKRLADDPELRQIGARSRELVRDWGYEPSVEQLRRGRARSDLAVDLFLDVGHVVPGRASCGSDAAAREPRTESGSRGALPTASTTASRS